jgi:chromosome segregation ATPase|tara:strand:+ start:308 stop:562 length:255 start_codon:yes stop_codon:yes gene_type:complete
MEERGNMDLEEQIDSLKKRVKELELINDTHQTLNGELRTELNKYKSYEVELFKANHLVEGCKQIIKELSAKLKKYESKGPTSVS